MEDKREHDEAVKAVKQSAILIAIHREHHIAGWERDTEAFTKEPVARFIGQCRLAFFVVDRQRKRELGL